MVDFKNTTDVLIVEVISELHKAHDQLNLKLFKNKLKRVQITISQNNQRNPNTLGSYSHTNNGEFIWNQKHNQITIWGLSFCGETIDVLATLVHEMCHQSNFENNIQDCEKNGRHNKKFKEAALKAKLAVDKPISKNKGFAYTQPSDELKNILMNLNINYKKIKELIYWKNKKTLLSGIDEIAIKNNSIRYKYTCLNCDINFNLSKELNLICGNCKSKLEVL